MRDEKWLENRLENIWNRYFSDIEAKNPISIRFGRRAKARLGSIKMSNYKFQMTKYLLKNQSYTTIITINGFFRDPKIPEFVVDGVIAHEFCHYIHGFNSSHPRSYQYPHYGGIVTKELKQRGLEDVLYLQKKWLKLHWKNYLKEKRFI